MAATGLLTPESSILEERAEHGLPPKSYAAAVVQTPPNEADNEDAIQSNGSTNGHVSYAKDGSSSSKTHVQIVEGQKLVNEQRKSLDVENLTSVEPKKDYQNALQHNEATGPRDRRKKGAEKPSPELASGRRAGAGWGRSASVRPLYA